MSPHFCVISTTSTATGYASIPTMPATFSTSWRLERIFVLHADPWPKRRHHYRRIVQHDTIARFYELLAPGGILRLATDDPGYLVWILARVTAHPQFRWTGSTIADFIERKEDWPETRYEAKATREGRIPVYMEFRKPA